MQPLPDANKAQMLPLNSPLSGGGVYVCVWGGGALLINNKHNRTAFINKAPLIRNVITNVCHYIDIRNWSHINATLTAIIK